MLGDLDGVVARLEKIRSGLDGLTYARVRENQEWVRSQISSLTRVDAGSAWHLSMAKDLLKVQDRHMCVLEDRVGASRVS